MKWICCLFFVVLHLHGFSQNPISLSGRVHDRSGEAIIGANVFLKGTYDGTSTDTEGHFHFTTVEKDSQLLVVSYLGFENQEIALVLPLEQDAPLAITLLEASSELATVVISAGAFEASDEKKGVVLRPLDIVTTAGATGDIVGALQTLPGTQRVGEDGRLFVRGGAAYETRTFIDGTYVASPYTSSTPNLPARGRFSPFLFKGTTFSTGGYSAEYGQALSSALILETQDLAPESLTSLSLMSVGLGAARTKRWENTSLSVSADYTDLSPYMGLVPQNIKWEKAPRTIGGQLIFRHQFKPGSLLKVQAQHHQSRFALHAPNPQELSQSIPVHLQNIYTYTNASWQTIFAEDWSFFIGGGYTQNTDKTSTIADIRGEQESLQAKVRLSRGFGQANFIRLGAEVWQEQFAERWQMQEANNQQTIRQLYGAAFAEIDWRISEKWVGRTGIRWETASLLSSARLSPRASIACKTGARSQISLSTGRFVQQPETEWLFQQSDLQFEEAGHYLVNWQWQKGGRTFRTEAFQKDYRSLVTLENATVANEGNGYARGIELFYRDRISLKNSDFWLSYSWLDTERKYRDFPVRATPSFAAEHSFSAVYKYWVPRWNMLVGATASYSSPRVFNNPNSPIFNDGQTTAFRDLSCNLSYLTQLGGHFTILYCSVSNVAGFENTFGQNFSGAPSEDGSFSSLTVRPPAKRFFFVGLFVSIGQKLDDNLNQ